MLNAQVVNLQISRLEGRKACWQDPRWLARDAAVESLPAAAVAALRSVHPCHLRASRASQDALPPAALGALCGLEVAGEFDAVSPSLAARPLQCTHQSTCTLRDHIYIPPSHVRRLVERVERIIPDSCFESTSARACGQYGPKQLDLS